MFRKIVWESDFEAQATKIAKSLERFDAIFSSGVEWSIQKDAERFRHEGTPFGSIEMRPFGDMPGLLVVFRIDSDTQVTLLYLEEFTPDDG